MGIGKSKLRAKKSPTKGAPKKTPRSKVIKNVKSLSSSPTPPALQVQNSGSNYSIPQRMFSFARMRKLGSSASQGSSTKLSSNSLLSKSPNSPPVDTAGFEWVNAPTNKALIANRPDLLTPDDALGQLIDAVKSNDIDAVQRYLRMPDVRQQAHQYNNRALRIAVRDGRVDIFSCLIKLPNVAQHIGDCGHFCLRQVLLRLENPNNFQETRGFMAIGCQLLDRYYQLHWPIPNYYLKRVYHLKQQLGYSPFNNNLQEKLTKALGQQRKNIAKIKKLAEIQPQRSYFSQCLLVFKDPRGRHHKVHLSHFDTVTHVRRAIQFTMRQVQPYFKLEDHQFEFKQLPIFEPSRASATLGEEIQRVRPLGSQWPCCCHVVALKSSVPPPPSFAPLVLKPSLSKAKIKPKSMRAKPVPVPSKLGLNAAVPASTTTYEPSARKPAQLEATKIRSRTRPSI